MKTLTGKQLRFVTEYMIDFNATQAYKRAGYSASNNIVAGANGRRLLEKEYIKAEIAKRQTALQKETEISQEWVLTQLQSQYDKHKDSILPGSAAAANKALELIGKHIGMFTDRLVHSGNIKEEITIEQCDAQIEEILSKYNKGKKE